MLLHEVSEGRGGGSVWEIWKGAGHKDCVRSLLKEICALLGTSDGSCELRMVRSLLQGADT